MGKRFVELCPFCGKEPGYDNDTQLVHCETLDCALGNFYIHIEEWNKRFDKKSKEN